MRRKQGRGCCPRRQQNPVCVSRRRGTQPSLPASTWQRILVLSLALTFCLDHTRAASASEGANWAQVYPRDAKGRADSLQDAELDSWPSALEKGAQKAQQTPDSPPQGDTAQDSTGSSTISSASLDGASGLGAASQAQAVDQAFDPADRVDPADPDADAWAESGSTWAAAGDSSPGGAETRAVALGLGEEAADSADADTAEAAFEGDGRARLDAEVDRALLQGEAGLGSGQAVSASSTSASSNAAGSPPEDDVAVDSDRARLAEESDAEPRGGADADVDTAAFDDADPTDREGGAEGEDDREAALVDTRGMPIPADAAEDASDPRLDRPDPVLDGVDPDEDVTAPAASVRNSVNTVGGEAAVALDRYEPLTDELGKVDPDWDSDPVQDLEKQEAAVEAAVGENGEWEMPQTDDARDGVDAAGSASSTNGVASKFASALDSAFSSKWLDAYKSFLVGQKRKQHQRMRVVKRWVPGRKGGGKPRTRTVVVKRLKKLKLRTPVGTRSSASSAETVTSFKAAADSAGAGAGGQQVVLPGAGRGTGGVLGGAHEALEGSSSEPDASLDSDASLASDVGLETDPGSVQVDAGSNSSAGSSGDPLAVLPAASSALAGNPGDAAGQDTGSVAVKAAGSGLSDVAFNAGAASSAQLTNQAGLVKAQATYVAWCGNNKPWNTATSWARFDMYGCLKVSGIHTGQTYLKTVVIIDRSDASNTYMKLPNSTQNAYAEELTLTEVDPVYPAVERALNVKSNVFCSTGQFTPDGTLLSIGGSSDSTNADPLLNGSYSIRAFHPCTNNTCDFQIVGSMSTKRWYPTAQIMPDGRVLISGGANVFGNIAINALTKNNPTVEYYPKKPGEPANYYLDFLVRTVPYNLYPFVHVLPSGRVFIFAADQYTLFDPKTNQEIPGTYPQLNATAENGFPIYRSYPISGTSAMFPLTPANNWTAEIMICGGNNAKATIVFGNGGQSRANGKIPADYYCWRIFPEAATPTWTPEMMCNWPKCDKPLRRVMGDMVLLVDGSVLIVNGAGTGYQGLKQEYASSPQLTPLIYFTANHSWMPSGLLPDSVIPRMYHSSALLLHDATVLITGSNPNPYLWTTGYFPTEFRMEKFIPPYLMTGKARPVIVNSPSSISPGGTFAVYFNATQPPTPGVSLLQRFTVAILYPGFSTHNQRHGMRNVVLNISVIARIRGKSFIAIVKGPKSLNIAPPTLYWLHVLDNGIPNVEGKPINVTQSATSARKR